MVSFFQRKSLFAWYSFSLLQIHNVFTAVALHSHFVLPENWATNPVILTDKRHMPSKENALSIGSYATLYKVELFRILKVGQGLAHTIDQQELHIYKDSQKVIQTLSAYKERKLELRFRETTVRSGITDTSQHMGSEGSVRTKKQID